MSRKYWSVLLLMTLVFQVHAAPDRYVSPGGSNLWPFTNWDMATPDLRLAVNTANSNNAGDIVWVSTGIYAPSARIVVSNTIVRGISGNAADIVITGNGNNECFVLSHPNAMLDSVTLSNGYYESSTRGGALTIYTGTVVNSVIGWSYAGYGGGVSMQGKFLESALIDRCLIISNSCLQTGGGVSFFRGGGTIRDSTVVSNLTASDGGGIGAYVGTNAAILNCLVQANTSQNGGGIYFRVAETARVWNCVVEGNWANGIGGGLYVLSAPNADVRNSIFRYNTATNNGGGVQLISTGKLRSCLIVSNLADGVVHGGGGIYLRYAPEIENCTIVANTAYIGGGIYQTLETNAIFRNCIIYDNIKTNAAYADTMDIGGGINSAQFFNCCSARNLGTVQNSITNAPLWVAGDNHRLQSDSPCINTGTNVLEWMADALDLDGHARQDRFSRKVDMGAYEYVPEGLMFMGR